MIFILNFVTVTKGTYPIIARDFFASIRFNSKLMTTYSNFKTFKAFLDAGFFLVKTRYGERGVTVLFDCTIN